jgi:BirA family biotin operon repressor/biotin-[acetyl-CoA-carboxylase] ligase
MQASFVKTLILREELGSTSDLARALVMKGQEKLPLLVRTLRQTAGRGRGANRWWSDEGSLTFTIALDPAAQGLEQEQGPRVALATAVAIIDAIEPELPGAPLGIRWPNDIEIGGRKLGGILPELVQTPAGRKLLVGIGLNVCTNFDSAPADVQRLATSLAAWAAAPLGQKDLDRLLDSILESFSRALDSLARGEPRLAQRWASLDMLVGQQVRIQQGSRLLRGAGIGIDAEGRLRLWSDQEVIVVSGGQVLRD